MPSIVQLLSDALDRTQHQRDTATGAAAREFALASTSIEDAIMRVNVGFARERGMYLISDVERAAQSEPQ